MTPTTNPHPPDDRLAPNQPRRPSARRPRRLAIVACATWVTCAAAALLGGCALPLTVYEDRYPMNDGWRPATVERTVAEAELPAALRPDCPSAGPTATARWAVVRYSDDGHARRVAVPVPAASPPAPGSAVYARVLGCARALAPRAVAD